MFYSDFRRVVLGEFLLVDVIDNWDSGLGYFAGCLLVIQRFNRLVSSILDM